MKLTRHLCALVSIVAIVTLLRAVIADEKGEKSGKGYVYRDTKPSDVDGPPEWDPNGYVIFCLCMGKLTTSRSSSAYSSLQ